MPFFLIFQRKSHPMRLRINRTRIVTDLSNGITRALIAINVLDEGVDLTISDAAVISVSKSTHPIVNGFREGGQLGRNKRRIFLKGDKFHFRFNKYRF